MFVYLQKHRKIILLIAAALLLLAVGSVLLHHHAEGDHAADCTVCHFTHHLACAFVFVAAAFIARPGNENHFFDAAPASLTSLCFLSTRQNRAPPFSV